MLSKTNVIAYVLGSLWTYFGGFILWGLIGDPLLKNHLGSATGLMKEEPDHLFLLLGCIILAIITTIIYKKWARGHHSISEGAQFGLLLGLLAGFASGMIDYSTGNMLSLSGFFINGLIYVVYYVILGVILSLIFNKFSVKS